MSLREPPAVRETLARAIGAARLRDGAAPRDLVDDLLPPVVARPESAGEVAELLGCAAREGFAVIPTAGGTRRAFGNPPERADVLLDLGALASLREWSPRDGVLVAEPALAVGDAERLVAADAQTLAGDWPVRSTGTLGGSAAAGRPPLDALGPAGPRWSVIGVEVALPDGTLRRHGARVAKNVAGFDVTRLHVGALGTLGVITEITLRARPRAGRKSETPFSESNAFRANVLGPDGTEVAAVELRMPGGRLAPAEPPTTLCLDEPADSASARDRFRAWLARWREVASAANGVAIVLAAPPSWKRDVDVWCGEPPAALPLMRKLKALYDPTRVLNPGRYVAGL
ncbi:MAG: FAD-binding oxidoreductase [Deltaproteobacteria bacterium]|nr:FAD-binding oxidoreductase [Deltaproteobacteria bacterium]